MYTVLIANQPTLDSLYDYLPFYQEAIDQKKIGICKWNEKGMTLKSALPELITLIEDKRHWRAIVIDLSHPFEQQNPYDLMTSWSPEEELKNPLLHLAHLLCGYPEVPDHLISDKKMWVQAQQDQKWNGVPPIELYLVTSRLDFDRNLAEMKLMWKDHHDLTPSLFWLRNTWPSKARFLVFDFESRGNFFKAQDELMFWMSILLLAVNQFDSAFFQAYKLYRINVSVDTQKFQAFLQTHANRLRASKEYIHESMKKNDELKLKRKIDLFELIPVSIQLPPDDSFFIKNKLIPPIPFPWLATSLLREINIWKEEKEKSEKQFMEARETSEDRTEEAIESARPRGKVLEETVMILDKPQKRDLTKAQDEYRSSFLEIRNQIAHSAIRLEKEKEKSERDVKRLLRQRMHFGPVLFFTLLALLLFVFSALPVLGTFYTQIYPIKKGWILYLLIACILIILTAYLAIYLQRRTLFQALKKYNRMIQQELDDMKFVAQNMSTYLSNIISHIKVKNYLKTSHKKEVDLKQDTPKAQQIKRINTLLDQFKVWAKIMETQIDLEDRAPVIYEKTNSDLYRKEPFHSFQINPLAQAEINTSGIQIESLHSFIKRLHLEQEEIYDQ